MPDPRIFAKFARDIAGWYGDVGRTAERNVLNEAQQWGREAGRFGSVDNGSELGFLSGALKADLGSVSPSELMHPGGASYPNTGYWDDPLKSGFTTFSEHVNEGLIPGFDMHSHPPLDPSRGAATYPTQTETKRAIGRGVAGPLAPSLPDASVWLRHFDPNRGGVTPRPEIRQTAYIHGSQPHSLLAHGTPEFDPNLSPADMYDTFVKLGNERSMRALLDKVRNSPSAAGVTHEYGATTPELWAALHTNRLAKAGVPMTFEDRAPFGKGLLMDAMSDFYKTSDRHGEGFEQGGPVDTPTEGEGGIYGAPDSMFNTPESLAAALYPQHNTAYGGGGPVDTSRPSDAYFNDPSVGSYRPLNFESLVGSGAARITQPGNGRDGGHTASDDPEQWSLVTHANDTHPDSVTRAWPDKPSAHGSAFGLLNDPGALYAGKYRQLLWSAKQRGMADKDIYLPSEHYPQHDTAYGGGGKVLRKAGQLARDALLGDLPEYKPGEETYLRFGKWPKSERSRNYIEGGREEGVSVYPLAPHGGPPLDWSDSGELDSHRYQRLKGSVFPYSPANPKQDHNHPSFLVQGREVGIGQDGEPLLREVKPLSRDWHSPQVGDNEAAPLSYFHRYDDEPLPGIVKPFDDQFADGGPIEMSGGGPLRKLVKALKQELFPSSNPKQDAYLRFGEWPENERSQNFIGGDREAGVSVYPLAHERGVPHPAVPEGEWTLDDYIDRLRDTKTPRWLVEGDQVGLGGDGEPLLRDVRRLGEYGQPYNPLTSTPTERFTDNYADGGPVEMALGGTPPLNTVPAVPDMPQLPESEGAGFFRNQDNYENSYAGPVKELVTKGANVARGKPQKPRRLPSEPAWDPARASALQYEIAGEGRGAGPLDLSAADQRIPNIVQEAIPRHDPARGVSPRMQDAINNPTVLYGIEDSIKNGMRIGADRWYHNNPIYQAFTRELGGEKGHTEFMKLMDYNSGSSPRSKVPDNIRNASYYFVNEGRDPRDWAMMPPNPAPYGHLAQDLHRGNADLVRIGEGDWGGYDVIKNPKPPSYGTNLGGNFEPVALDSHAFKNIAMRAWDPRFLATSLSDFLTVNPFSKDSLAGVSDDLAGRASFAQRYGTPNGRKDGKFRIDYAPQSLVNSGRLSMEDALARPALWDAKPRNNEYAAGERLYQNMSRDMGLAPAEGQSAAWAGAGELTGLGTPADRTFSEMFNERVLLTAKLRGEDPQDTLRKLIRREAPLMAEGGTVEDQYHPIWQQSFAGGGQPDRPRLDGFDAMARNRPDEYDPVSASLYPWLMDKEDFQPDYGFRKIDGPLDLTHNMDNSLLFQSREPFEGRGFTLTPEEKRAKWLEQRGLEAKPESDINPYDIIKAYAHSLGQRHKEWKPSYSGESLPWQMLQSVGDLGRVASKSVTGDFGDTLSASMRPWDGSYEDRLMQENDLTRQSERDIHPLLKDITSIPALISQRLWAAPAIGDAASNLATPANSVGEWANNQIRPIVGALRNMPDAINRARDMFSGVQPEGRMEPSYYDHGGSVEDQYHPIWSQNFKRGGDVHDILGMLGGLAGNLIPIPVLGPMLGKFAGHTLGNLIEGGSDEIGDDAARDFSFGMADPDAQGWAFGGPIGPTLPKDDFTSGGEEPGMPSFGVGIPGFDVPPLLTNPQIARDKAERNRLMQMTEQAAQKGLADQMKAKESGGGGGLGGMLSSLAPFASMIPGYGPMIGAGMSMAGGMMKADGGSIPAPNGEQPWMYGGGALMARGGYLSMQEGGAPRAYRDDSGNFTYQGNSVQAGDKYLSEGIPLTWARDDVLGETGSVEPDSMYARMQMRGGKQSDFRNARQLLAGPLFAEGGYLRSHGGMNG